MCPIIVNPMIIFVCPSWHANMSPFLRPKFAIKKYVKKVNFKGDKYNSVYHCWKVVD